MIATRSYYPVNNKVISKLMTMRNAIGKELKTYNDLINEMYKLTYSYTDLNLLYDYYNHSYVTDDTNTYGAKAEKGKPLGGGFGYTDKPSPKKVPYTVYNDDDFYEALKMAKSGDVIYVFGEIVIDLSDWIVPGDLIDFMNPDADHSRIPLFFTVPEGVTLKGIRGENGEGAVLKTTSYVNTMLTLKAGSRLSGLVIQGADNANYINSPSGNLSLGIAVAGDNVMIDNCEISGFYRSGITIMDSKNVTVASNYIHHILGADTGMAFFINNSSVTINNNVFSKVNRLISASGNDTEITFTNNIDAGNLVSEYFLLNQTATYDNDFTKARLGIKSLICKNNTLLSPVRVLNIRGLPLSATIENNVFGYADFCYAPSLLTINSVDASVFNSRFVMKNNVYDVENPYVASKSSSGSATPSDTTLGAYSVKENVTLSAFGVEAVTLPEVTYATILQPLVISGSYHTDYDDYPYLIPDAIISTFSSLGDKKLSDTSLNYLTNMIRDMGQYCDYLDYYDKLSVEIDGKVYGAYKVDDNPFGGGYGYNNIIHYDQKTAITLTENGKSVYIVTSKEYLIAASKVAKAGDIIYVPEGVVIDMANIETNTVDTIKLEKGVTLASDRGYLHADGTFSTGGMIKNTKTYQGTIITLVDDCHVTGMIIEGPDPARHLRLWDRAFKGKTDGRGSQPGHKYSYNAYPSSGIAIRGDNIEIDNCEFSGFSSSAISVGTNADTGISSRGLKVHHCYIHHNQMNSLGYGVCHGEGYSIIYANLFNFNRHSIAGGGQPASGYDTYCNVEMGESIGHYFDMHGGGDRRDGTDIAGDIIDVHNNTFLGSYTAQRPYNVRGVPLTRQTFDNNICYYMPEIYGAASRMTGQNFTIGKNIWNYGAKYIILNGIN